MKRTIKTPWGFKAIYLPSNESKRLVFKVIETDIQTVHLDVCQQLHVSFCDQFSCIKKHIRNNNRFFWKIDLQRAFDSLSFERLKLLENIPDEICHTPNLFFHSDSGLIQGSPASNKLFQWYCEKTIDRELAIFCERNNLVWTRFVDDILFSSKIQIGKRARKKIRAILQKFGFSLNKNKTVLADTLHQPILYLGVQIHKGKANLSGTFQEKLLSNPSNKNLRQWEARILALNGLS